MVTSPRAGLIKRAVALLLAVLLGIGLVNVGAAAPARAADPTASLSIQKAASAQTVKPGQSFTYTIQVQCTAGTVNGCLNAAIDDPLPDYLTITGPPSVTGTSNYDASGSTATELSVTFSDNLGGGQTGLAPGNVVTITVPVKVDEDAPATADGQVLTNTATVTADNATEKEASRDVTLNVPASLAASTTKSLNPAGGQNVAGTSTTATVSGTNNSNVPVHQLVINDPVPQDDGTPPTTGNSFQYLELSTLNSVTYPDGADTAQLRVYDGTEWVDGPVANAPASPALPAGVDPADVTGVQIIFTDTSGDGIPPDASANVSFDLALREVIAEDDLPLTITNTSDTTVIDSNEDSATSDPASATYRIPPNEVDVAAGKTFDPATVHVGDPSTVTLTGTNSSSDPIDSMTITEPAPGTPNHLANGGLAFTSMGSPAGSGVVWPDGATSASITYSCDGTPGSPQTTTTVDTLPAPPAGCDPVTGFSVTFAGSISAGAEATIPFVVTTNTDQGPTELNRFNTVRVHGERAGSTGDATHTAVIKSIKDRIDVDVSKTLYPSQIPSYPGEIVTAELSGRLLPFPDSTVDASTIVVQDPAAFPDPNGWYDAFDPQAVTATPVPACSTLSVQYTTDEGGSWADIPGMESIHGSTIFNGTIPDDVSAAADGIRFVYTADPAGGSCSGGFPADTSVSPNLSYSLEQDESGSDATLTNCARSTATAPSPTPAAQSDPACDDVTLNPPDTGSIDPIDKSWDKASVVERSQSEAGATLSWSTNGYTGTQRIDITDTQNPDTTPLPNSAFDTFDLVRIDPITPELDPLLTYDQITKLQLFELPDGSTNPADGSWVDATGDPCPSACDGTFPGYTLTAAERTATIGFRLSYIESPTRVDRLGTPGAPPVGSGVASSSGNNRHVHPVFQLRDTRRSDSTKPVVAQDIYNATDPGVVDNTVRLDPYWNVNDTEPILTRTDHDTILITNVDVTVDGTKTWSGGPMGIPENGVPQSQYPTSRVTLTASNTTPSKIDELTITEPDTSDQGPGSCTTSPFDQFNLARFTTITPPADIGASDVTIHLSPGPDGKSDYTRDEALALTESQLSGVTSMTVTYTGRIDAATDTATPTATVTFDARLRTESREEGSAPEAGSVCDQVKVEATDMVDFPGYTDTVDAYRDADIDLVTQGIEVTAGKSITPTIITEPSHGPATVTLSGQPSGSSRTVMMVLQDTSPTFFNQYDFAGFNPITWVNPVNQVQLDAYVGGSWSLNDTGQPVVTGGHWVTGTEVVAPDTTLALPDGVSADQVQGLRFTFAKSDGSNWENPANPTQTASFTVNRRDDLHTGGPVPSDLAGTPAPGEASPGEASNTTTATATSSDVDANGDPLTASADANATVLYHHANNAVQIRKAPNGDVESPGTPFKYTVTVKNTGDVDITNPVLTDVFPTDGQGPQIQLAPDPQYAFAIAGGTGMPTDPSEVDIAASAGGLVFTFPDGSTLPIGATYTITYMVVTRPGLAADTQFTNTVGVKADRPWDACDSGTGGGLDPESGQCQAIATNTVTSAGAVSVSKQVKAQGSDVLGVAVDPLYVSSPEAGCTPDKDGFYARPCIPIAEPGGDITWRWHFQNSGNLSLDRIQGIDRLPAPGDTLATAPDLTRLSQWQPVLSGVRPTGPGDEESFHVYYTIGSDWCDGPQGQDGQLLCPALDWQEWPAGQTLADLGVDPASVTGLLTDYVPVEPLAPAATFNVDVPMTAPPYSPADHPNTTAMSDTDTYAFNTVGASARVTRDSSYTLTTEPPRVGVGLAHGGLRVLKEVTGAAADQYAPDTFRVRMRCTSAGQNVPLGSAAVLSLTPGTPVTVYDLPYHATCTLTEGDNGQTSSSSTTATVERDIQDVQTATLTNVYDYASLAVTKNVDSSAVDQDGKPVPYGPFTVEVACTYKGNPDYAEGYGPDQPMTADLSDSETVTFTHLHPDDTCSITETDTKGTTSTTIVTKPSNGDATSTDGTSATIELDPDTGTHPPNTASISNAFGAGSINVIKKVTGTAAGRFGVGPFTLTMTCVLEDASGTRTIWDGTIELGGDAPLQATIDNLAAGATCTIAETDDAGATASTIDPSGPIPVDANETATVTATNRFDPATLYVQKKIDGDAAGSAPKQFAVEVTCRSDGAILPGFPMTVEVSPGAPVQVGTLLGAECTAVETQTGHATTVSYDPKASDDSDGSGPVEVTADQQNRPTITITNTFSSSSASPSSSPPSSPSSVPAPPPDVQGPGNALGVTGAPVTQQLRWALALLAAGAALIMLARLGRRRDR